jgi:hypothetical protein
VNHQQKAVDMSLRIMFIVAAYLAGASALILPAGKASAQTAKDVVGTWTMVSNVTDQSGKKIEPFGANPKGIMVLEASGRYVLAVSRAGLPKLASNSRASATAEENAAVVQGSIFHFGTYTVDEAGKTITFRIETSSFANWNGIEQKRAFIVTGDQLKYTIPESSIGGVSEVVWERTK